MNKKKTAVKSVETMKLSMKYVIQDHPTDKSRILLR